MYNTALIRINKKKLSELVYSERTKQGISKQELIRICSGKIGRTTLISIEHGKKNSYREDILIELSKALNIDYGSMLYSVCIETIYGNSNETEEYISADKTFMNYFNTPYTILSPNDDDLHWIESVEKKLYYDLFAIPHTTLSIWLKKNPYCITVMKNSNQQLCGYLIVLPVNSNVYRRFISGEIYDKDFGKDDIIAIDEKERVEYLFAGTLAVLDEDFDINIIGINEYLKKAPYILSKICNFEKCKRMFTYTAKKGDEILLKQLGFSRITSPKENKKELNMYHINFQSLLQRLFDLSQNSLY